MQQRIPNISEGKHTIAGIWGSHGIIKSFLRRVYWHRNANDIKSKEKQAMHDMNDSKLIFKHKRKEEYTHKYIEKNKIY